MHTLSLTIHKTWIILQNATELAENSDFKALLNSAVVITDEQRRIQVEVFASKSGIRIYRCMCTQTSGPDHRVDPDKHRKASFLFPESTQEFEQLPLEFRVSVWHSYGKEHVSRYIVQFRVIVDMPSLFMIVFSSLLILTLESSTIKENIFHFLVKKQLIILLLILMSKLILLALKWSWYGHLYYVGIYQ